MNFCFEKFVGFKGIMSDGLDRIVPLKNSVFFIILSKLLKRMQFSSYFIKLCEYRGNFQSSYETKTSFIKNIMRLILEEVVMLDSHMSNGQIYSFLQLFFNTEKLG